MTFFSELVNGMVTSVMSIGIKDVIEIIILAILLFCLIMLLKNTRAWAVIKGGVAILLFVFLFAKLFQFDVILYLVNRIIDVIILAIIVILAPEIRAGLERLGKKNNIIKSIMGYERKTDENTVRKVEEETVRAVFDLASTRTGALICFEGEDTLQNIVDTGIEMDASISSQLLVNIFEHNTPLHDGAAVIKDGRIEAATCYLPLSDSYINKRFGTRHRAALGLSETSDALVIIVSEETGIVSVAQGGALKADLTEGDLRREINAFLKKDEKPIRRNKKKRGGK